MLEFTRFPHNLLLCCLIVALQQRAYAQITPDNTLGKESSVVAPNTTINGANADLINGGALRGNNLFHSFTQFNIGDGQRVYFGNPAGVQNIFTRVTGGNASNIFGTLGVNGAANLFFMNPNGILFGKNARLDIAGSFTATTASSIRFLDGTEFSTSPIRTAPLLTVSAPVGLQFEGQYGNIINQSTTYDDTGQTIGLQVQPNKTLAFVGGNVTLDGGVLTAPGGNIELGSVTGNGFVSLTPTSLGWVLGYESAPDKGDILMSKAMVDVSGERSGSLTIDGARVTLTAQISSTSYGFKRGGDLNIFASDSVQVNGIAEDKSFLSNISTGGYGFEANGNLTIDTRKLIVRDGGRVTTNNQSPSLNAGTLNIHASDYIKLDGSDFNGVSGVFSQASNSGVTGDILIDTGKLIITSGGQISTSSVYSGVESYFLFFSASSRTVGASLTYNIIPYSTYLNTRF